MSTLSAVTSADSSRPTLIQVLSPVISMSLTVYSIVLHLVEHPLSTTSFLYISYDALVICGEITDCDIQICKHHQFHPEITVSLQSFMYCDYCWIICC